MKPSLPDLKPGGETSTNRVSFPADFLSFSAGTGSSGLLWMVLKGNLPRPEHFYVLNADPGMEDYRSYLYVDMMKDQCEAAGIKFFKAPGPNLYEDLINKKGTRIDNPPFWTINTDTGKRGRLNQKCTRKYKIAPMDRVTRQVLENDFGINLKSKRLPNGCVRKWIGFTADEWHRVSPSDRKYIQFRYPLIELGLDKPALSKWMQENNIPEPPRSVCVGCYANDLEYFKTMAKDRPGDFEKACLVDDAVRDMRQYGIRDMCFVSSACIPLRELQRNGFKGIEPEDIKGCHSGYCFV